MNPRILASLLPVAVFWGLTRISSAEVAILGGFAASTAVFYANRRDRLIGALTAFGFCVVAVSAVIGIASSSEKAYLASGPVADFLFVPLYLGSVAIGRPLVGGIARELFPGIAGHIPVDARVFAWLSVAWAAWNLLQGLGRALLLSELSVGEYVIWSRLLAWPPTTALLALTAWAVLREARRRGADWDGGLGWGRPGVGAEAGE